MQAKTWLAAYFKRLYLERKGKPNPQTDILGVLLAHKDNPQAKAEVQGLDDDMIADNLVLMWFGSYDTTSTTIIWVLKFLNDHPDCSKKVKVRNDIEFPPLLTI
jgi:cytochrome P450